MEVSFGDNSLQEFEAAHERCPLKWAKLKFYAGGKQPIQPMNKLICSSVSGLHPATLLKNEFLKSYF